MMNKPIIGKWGSESVGSLTIPDASTRAFMGAALRFTPFDRPDGFSYESETHRIRMVDPPTNSPAFPIRLAQVKDERVSISANGTLVTTVPPGEWEIHVEKNGRIVVTGHGYR